jgi:serine/threonine protein kinase
MVTAMDDGFPIGESLEGGGVITDAIRGDDARGMFRAVDAARRRLLVTVTSRQTRPLDVLADELDIQVDGVARLRDISPLGDSHVAMVEEEPAGVPSSDHALPLRPGAAVALAGELAAVLERAHAEGLVILGVRPELVYLEERGGALHVSGLAPRADLFVTGATAVYGAKPLFDQLFAAPELLTMQTRLVGPASDVFSLAAVVAVWLTGEHPFEGETPTAQLGAIVNGRGRPWRGPAALGMALSRGLERAPAARPSLSQLIAGLRAAGDG